MAPTTPPSHLETSLKSQAYPIILRNVTLSDAPALAALLSDHRNTLFESPNPPPQMPVSTAEMVITRMRESAAAPSVLGADGRVTSGPGRVNLSVVYVSPDGSTDKMIGLAGFGSIKDLDDAATGAKIRVGDVGVMLDSDYRRRGFAAEAIRLSVAWGFAKLDEGGLQLDKITAGTLVENDGMVKLLEEKLGWKGIRQASEVKEGKEEMFYEIWPPGI
ncbi:putative gcn5-related n-acetyltransferase protein [Phaeoacremonium minimum UCRPA7]|uniref:Putative gcn5-related n-acetyltransferase protein n=1 Tax=Phaeoacremonium minimum (strain UCR-PA7) TaxID=1286976 RepID=R8BUW0_PHAM7|nr:putative gcn5-related n-acetyltransferase protein [Phaeoacremonium minimum UCRPA7]EOO03100.1 putative gcn5-related n-acetyltransferase protein [Phaeoacremonium minimum UCRPA7]